MERRVQNQEQLNQVRHKHKQVDAHIVRYEDVERNINDIIYGDSKITPLALADLNNLIEGVVLDQCIELEYSTRQKNNPTPLTDCLIEMSDIVVPNEVGADSDSKEWCLRQSQQIQVEFVRRFLDFLKSGKFGKDLQIQLMSLISPVILRHPELRKIMNLSKFLQEGRIEEYVNQLSNFNPYFEILDENLLGEIFKIYEHAGIISSIYNTDLSIDDLNAVLPHLLSEEEYDPMYSWAKAASLAYQNYYGSKGMSVRLPAQLRYPQIHGIGTPQVSYEVYKHIADLHKLSIETLIRYGGTIEIYIPPLLSLLLDRCSKPKDIPKLAVTMRGEFEKLRLSIRDYLSDVNASGTLKEQIEAAKEMKKAIDSLKSTLAKAKKSLVYQTWDVVKAGDPMKIFTGTLDLLIEKDTEKQVVRRVHPFIDMWTLFFDVQDYGRLLVKVFGENRIDYAAFKKSDVLSKSCEQFMFPFGREHLSK
jgi:hypothetical protein